MVGTEMGPQREAERGWLAGEMGGQSANVNSGPRNRLGALRISSSPFAAESSRASEFAQPSGPHAASWRASSPTGPPTGSWAGRPAGGKWTGWRPMGRRSLLGRWWLQLVDIRGGP